MELKGLSAMLKNLEKSGKDRAKKTENGIKKAGLFLQRESQKIVPVNEGNLKASAFTRKEEGTSGMDTIVGVGYTANYALYVHEDKDDVHGAAFNAKYAYKILMTKIEKSFGFSHDRYWHNRGVNQQYKFLEKPMKENRDKILTIIKNEAEK